MVLPSRLESQRLDKVDGLLKTLPHNTWRRQFWENVRSALTRRWANGIT